MKTRLMSCVLLGLVVGSAAARAEELRVGIAALDITPPLGAPMAGYYHARGADGVVDPLHAKALVIEYEGRRAALVVLDLISVPRTVTDRARAEIGDSLEIPGECVMVSATHTHTGPELAGRGRRGDDQTAGTTITAQYTDALPGKIAACVRAARDDLRPARLLAAAARCENLTFNRRYYLRDGSVGWNPGKKNPNIVMPAGPTDPEVGILYAERPGATGPAQAIATYVNFAMHSDTCGGSRFSADWPGALGRVLGAYHGEGYLALVTLGTCGNLNHIDTDWRWPQNTPIEQHRIATILGAAVFQAYKDLRPVAPGLPRGRSESVELALPEVTAEQVEEARQILAEVKDDRGANFLKQVRAYRVLDIAAREGKPMRVEVQAIALGGEVAWVGLPGEVFVEVGLASKRRSPFAQTFVVELANENIGYIPDRRSYAEGAYEAESARCAAGSGERLVDAAVSLLESLRQEASGQ